MDRWRLILDPDLSGQENMAIDESILRISDSGGAITPTLRIYGWKAPTISIGYLQKAGPLEASGLPVVRRITGGRAVLHDIEITYSIVAGLEAYPFSGGITSSYSAISRCIISALKGRGVEASFSRGGKAGGAEKDACFYAPSRYEVLVDGRKLVGSSQRRFKRCFLQHGSILLGVNEELNEKVFGRGVIERMAWLDGLGVDDKEAFKKALVDSMAEGLDASFTQERLTDEEEALKEGLIKDKYTREEWNLSPLGRLTASPA